MKKLVLFITGLVCAVTIGHAQSPPKIKPLHIGDTVPDLAVLDVVNYKDSKVKLSYFNGKLVILDFWATYCSPCIAFFPKLDQLQIDFPKQLQILLVTSQDKNQILRFNQAKKIKLPSVVHDRMLTALFPHNSIPHDVWIKDGKVFAITQPNYITANNIRAILSGNINSLPLKMDNLTYDINTPLLIDGNGGTADDLLYHSVFTRYLDGINGGGGTLTDSSKKIFKITVINANVLRLYQRAASMESKTFNWENRCLVEVKNKNELLYTAAPQFNPSVRPHFYSYELVIPLDRKDSASRLMFADFNRFFGARYNIEGKIENREVQCWVLKKLETKNTILTRGRAPSVSETANTEIWENQPFNDVFYAFASLYKNVRYPLIDSTGITGNVDMALPLHLAGLNNLNRFLSRFGLIITPQMCNIKMLVLKTNTNT